MKIIKNMLLVEQSDITGAAFLPVALHVAKELERAPIDRLQWAVSSTGNALARFSRNGFTTLINYDDEEEVIQFDTRAPWSSVAPHAEESTWTFKEEPGDGTLAATLAQAGRDVARRVNAVAEYCERVAAHMLRNSYGDTVYTMRVVSLDAAKLQQKRKGFYYG